MLKDYTVSFIHGNLILLDYQLFSRKSEENLLPAYIPMVWTRQTV